MWKVNDECFFIISNTFVEKAAVKKIMGEFVIIQTDYGKTINLRRSRLYRSEEEAKEHCGNKIKKKTPYDYM